MRRTICNLLILIACIVPACGTFASEQPQPVARIAFTSFPPWCFKNKDGQYTGVLVDYLRDLAQDVGIKLQEDDIPIARLHHSLRNGKLDLFFSKVPEKGFDCCQSLGKAFDGETVIIGRKSGPEWDPSQPAGHSICRTGLSGYNVPGFRMFDADSLETCVRMVSRDRLPFLMGERYSLNRILQAQKSEVIALFATPRVIDKQQIDLFISRTLDQTFFGPLLRKAFIQRPFSHYVSRYIDSKP